MNMLELGAARAAHDEERAIVAALDHRATITDDDYAAMVAAATAGEAPR